MKILIFAVFASLLGSPALAEPAPELASNVLAESRMVVGFAPPEHTGTYKTQILTNGKVQSINNKGKVKSLAVLSAGTLKKLKDSIKNIGEFKTIEPQGPICMDAPSQMVIVNVNKKSVRIWANFDCREHLTDNVNANQIAQAMNSLKNSFSQLDSIE